MQHIPTYNGVVCTDGCYLDMRSIKDPERLLNQFTLHKELNDNETLTFELCDLDYKRKLVAIPRFAALAIKHNYTLNIEHVQLPKPAPIDTSSNKIKLRKYQAEFLNVLEKQIFFNADRIKYGMCGAVMQMSVGLGKSFIAAKLIADLKVKTLIIVCLRSIHKMWTDLLTELFPDLTIGAAIGAEFKDGDIIVAMVNGALERNAQGMFGDVGLTVVDECHTLCTKQRSRVFTSMQTKYMLGMSATPRRSDGLDLMATWGLGATFRAVDHCKIPEKYCISCSVQSILYPNRQSENRYWPITSFGRILFDKTLKRVLSDETRLNVIVERIADMLLNKPGTKILALCGRVNYLLQASKLLTTRHEFIMDMVSEETLRKETHAAEAAISSRFDTFSSEKYYESRTNPQVVSTVAKTFKLAGKKTKITPEIVQNKVKRAVVITSKNNSKQLNLLAENADIVFSTFQYMGTGISIPSFNSLVLLSTIKSQINLEQYVGRIKRITKENLNDERIIVDMVDNWSIFKQHYDQRKEFYKSQNFQISEEEAFPEENDIEMS